MRQLLRTPVFASEDSSQRARIFLRVVWLMMGTTSAALLSLIVVQPDVAVRALTAIGIINGLGLTLVWVNNSGRTQVASWALVIGLVVLVSGMALQAGGIRSPGVTFYFVFVLMAGVLLGQRAGMLVAGACATLALGLVVLEVNGLLPAQTVTYRPESLWVLNVLYIGVVLILLQLATSAMKHALDRAQTELSERRDAERRLEMALDAGAIGTWDYDVSRREFSGDARAFSLLGLGGAGRLVAIDEWAALVHPEDDAHVREVLTSLANGSVRAARVEYRVARPDGSRREVDVAARAITADDGTAIRVTGTIIDATERKAAEREREHLLYRLAERVKELRLLHTAARLVQDERAVDRTVFAELVRLMPDAWQYPECCQARIAFGDIDERTPGWQDSPWRQTARFTTIGGPGLVEVAYTTERPAEAEGPFLAEERDLINSLAEIIAAYLQRHFTEARRRTLEHQLRQSQKMEALGTMAGGIAHDFNNILTAIGGNVALAVEDVAPDHPGRESIDEIGRAHGRAVDLVRRILTFSRKQDTKKTAVHLPAVVDEAVQLLRVSLPKAVAVQTSYAADLPPVLADTTQIHQIVMNLGTNAGHAMKDTGGTLTCDVSLVVFDDESALPSLSLKAASYLALAVSDTGTGIPADVLDRLFEPFYTTKGDAGTGLGLSVVHGIVREHGGDVLVESTPGHGTTFTVYFPAGSPS